MIQRPIFYAPLLFAACAFAADEPSSTERVAKLDARSGSEQASSESAKPKQAQAETGAKTLSGISILGNQEAPKALVIAPWKSSQLGDSQGLSRALDDGRQPVDKDVFMRELAYYEIRSE